MVQSKVVGATTKLAVEAASLATPRGRLIAFSVLAGVLRLIGPHRLEQGRSLCLIRNITGQPCPACGMTRAMSALLKGQVKTAARYNLLVFPASAIATALYIKDIYTLLQQPHSKQ
ncbi:MAG: hypothetical protein JWP00_4284 [Chloroflexi bacterium]|jgi:hypothetical protein|nr:hypothetical protein [Chloroflexota bacterium]